MREKLPVVIALAALGVALVLGFWMRFSVGRSTESEPPQSVAAAPASGRSVRVEERLQQLRESYAQRQLAAAAKPGDAEAGSTRTPVGGTPAAPSAEQQRGMRREARAGWHTQNAAGSATPKVAQPAPAPAPAPAHAPPHWPAQVVGSNVFQANYNRGYVEKNTSVDELEETILHGTDNAQRKEALDELSLKEPEDALRVLSAALLEENLDPSVYVGVLELLSDYDEDVSPDMLAPALRNQNAEVRFAAVSLLGDMDTAAARDALKGATSDPDPEVRDLARGILDLGS